MSLLHLTPWLGSDPAATGAGEPWAQAWAGLGTSSAPQQLFTAAVAFGLWFVQIWEQHPPDTLASSRCAGLQPLALRCLRAPSGRGGSAQPLWGAPRRALGVSRSAGGTWGSPLSVPRALRCLGSTAGACMGWGLRFHSPRFLCGTSSYVHAGTFPEMARGEPAAGSCKTLISRAARNPAGPEQHFSGTSSWKQADIFF